MTVNLNDFYAKAKHCSTIEALNKLLSESLAQDKIDAFAFTYYFNRPRSNGRLQYQMSSPKYQRWHQHYIEEGYEDVDSTTQSSFIGNLPIYWQTQDQIVQAQTEREKQLRQATLDFGINAGMSIPVHNIKNGFGILLLVQMQGQDFLCARNEKQFSWMSLATIYFECLSQLLLSETDEVDRYRLSFREKQCLRLLKRELSVKEMAESLSVAERTINFHMQNINKKLGAKNKYQSLTMAIEENII